MKRKSEEITSPLSDEESSSEDEVISTKTYEFFCEKLVGFIKKHYRSQYHSNESGFLYTP